jgi:hypothetical protein
MGNNLVLSLSLLRRHPHAGLATVMRYVRVQSGGKFAPLRVTYEPLPAINKVMIISI